MKEVGMVILTTRPACLLPFVEKSLEPSNNSSLRQGTLDAMRRNVQGAITGRDVIFHSLTILRFWGPTCYVRCLRAIVSRQQCTFLQIVSTQQGRPSSPV